MFKIIPIIPTSKAFEMGRVVMTANASDQLDFAAIYEGLRRHASGDWGDLPDDDRQMNETAVKEGERLLSAYGEGEKRFWIITEADRSVTTVLMPDDY